MNKRWLEDNDFAMVPVILKLEMLLINSANNDFFSRCQQILLSRVPKRTSDKMLIRELVF